MCSDWSRRAFIIGLILGAGNALGQEQHKRLTMGTRSTLRLPRFPPIEGTLAYDEATLNAMAGDIGKFVRQRPVAVLRPASAEDVVLAVRYARMNSLKVAVRGQGHASFGQAQVRGGIVIDSRSMAAVQEAQGDSVDAQAGALWSEIAEATLPKGFIPPVMTHCPDILTVGGTLSVGGLSNTSHIFGAGVDHVRELDVITGEGQLVTCSAKRRSDLFTMALAGLGQFGIITRAKLALVPAPHRVALQKLLYNELEPFLAEIQNLSARGIFDHVGGVALPKSPGGWTFAIEVGAFYSPPIKPKLAPAGLTSIKRSDIEDLSFASYLRRDSGHRMPSGGTPSPFVAFWMPVSAVNAFARSILADRDEAERMWLLGLNIYPTRHFTRPMFKVPAGNLAAVVWVFHVPASVGDLPLRKLIDKNRALYEQVRNAGGNVYPAIRSFPFSQQDWRDHFGVEMWQRVSKAKTLFDAQKIFTPGQNMFS